MDLRSVRDETEHEPLGLRRVDGPEDGNAVRLERGRGSPHASFVGDSPETAYKLRVDSGLEFGNHLFLFLPAAVQICLQPQLPYCHLVARASTFPGAALATT